MGEEVSADELLEHLAFGRVQRVKIYENDLLDWLEWVWKKNEADEEADLKVTFPTCRGPAAKTGRRPNAIYMNYLPWKTLKQFPFSHKVFYFCLPKQDNDDYIRNLLNLPAELFKIIVHYYRPIYRLAVESSDTAVLLLE